MYSKQVNIVTCLKIAINNEDRWQNYEANIKFAPKEHKLTGAHFITWMSVKTEVHREHTHTFADTHTCKLLSHMTSHYQLKTQTAMSGIYIYNSIANNKLHNGRLGSLTTNLTKPPSTLEVQLDNNTSIISILSKNI